MRKTVTSAAGVVFLVLGAVAMAQSPTVDELVAKNIQSKGGLEKLRAIQTMKQTSRVSMQNMNGTMVVYGKRPNLIRQEFSFSGETVLQVFDGTAAWMINPFAGAKDPLVITGPQADAIKEQSDFESPFVDYKEKGYRIELIGTETTAGRRLHHLKVTSLKQRVQHCYLDADTGLEARIVSESPAGLLEQELSDYRDVDGIKVPFSIRTLSAGVPMMSITVEKVEINPKIDDAIFKTPNKKK